MSYEITFKEGLPHECTCPLCEQAFRAPIVTACGHNFCRQCIETTEGSVPCPVCQAEVIIETLKSDKNKHRQVQALLVKCPFHHNGCSWEGPLKQMQKHAENCEYHAILCVNGCGKMIPEREMAEHLGACRKKLARCNYCNLQVKNTSLEKHLKICPRMIISCPFQCGLVDRTREEIEKHRSSCPNVDNGCPFVELGCAYIGNKGSVQKHLTSEPIRHLMYLCDEVTELKNFHIMIQSQNAAIEERYEDLMRRTQTAAQMYGAQFIWRIEDVAQKMNDAKSGACPIIHSEPFVSGRHGYKFVASACLFGDGQCRGKYMSVYLTLVRGKYDSLLKWPFDRVICITLLDQNSDANQRCDISYRVNPSRIKDKTEFLARPLLDRNGSFGAQTFCRLEIMGNYIKDDVMFLQFEIAALKEPDDMYLSDPGKQPHITKQNFPKPDTRSVISMPIMETPREEGRISTDMKVPEDDGEPILAKNLMGSRDSLSQLPPQPIMPDGLQPVNASSTKLHTPKPIKNKITPEPQLTPIVVSEKSEVPKTKIEQGQEEQALKYGENRPCRL